jgi:hypothetical protein
MISDTIYNLIIFEIFLILNYFEHVVLFYDFIRLKVDLDDSSLHVNVGVNVGFFTLDYVFELVDAIDFSSVLSDQLFFQNDKVFVNNIDYWASVCQEHVCVIAGKTPSIFLPLLYLFNLKRSPIQSINFLLSPCQDINIISLFQPCRSLQKYFSIDWIARFKGLLYFEAILLVFVFENMVRRNIIKAT